MICSGRIPCYAGLIGDNDIWVFCMDVLGVTETQFKHDIYSGGEVYAKSKL